MSPDCESPVFPKRLLLVACNSNFRRTLERILCRCGYAVDGVASGEEALSRMESGPYDAVISEVFLPGTVCGLTVIERVHRRRPELPIILLTEGETARLRSKLPQCRSVHCLALPIDVDQLKLLIASSTAPPHPSL
jgi:DNA-binding NtrC family response regulator